MRFSWFCSFLLAALCVLPITLATSQASPPPESEIRDLAHDQLPAQLGAGLNDVATTLALDTDDKLFARDIIFKAGGENSSPIDHYGDEEVATENLAGGYPDIHVLPSPNYNVRYPRFQVLPHPARNGRLLAQGLPLAQRIGVKVFDTWGNVVRRQILRRSGIEMADLPDGLYILTFRFGGEAVFAQVGLERAAP